MQRTTTKYFIFILTAVSLLVSACSPAARSEDVEKLVVYSGRSESLVAPVIQQFRESTGIEVEVRYGSTSEIAATLLEEGQNSPADVFFAQDPGGLGAVAAAGMLAPLPDETLQKVPAGFRSPDGLWVGVSGRARTVVYNTSFLKPEDLPRDLRGFTDPQWKGKIGWVPTNASFQAMVTAMRSLWGEAETSDWLAGIQANDPVAYESNTAVVQAVGAGEVEVGFVNHYYLYRFIAEEGPDFPARNYFLANGGPDSLVMPAGAGLLKTGRNQENAIRFINFLLSPVAQAFFANQTFEYPLIADVKRSLELPALEELNPPAIDLTDLADLQGTVRLLQQVGVLP